MESSELLLTVGKVLEESATLKTWCNSEFSQEQTVYIGIDTENPPLETDYPLIMVYYTERLKGESQKIQTFSVEIGCGIFKDELGSPEPLYPRLKVYSGLLLVEKFRELVENALFNAAPKQIRGVIDVTGETTTEVYYPFFRSNTLVSIQFVRTSRKPLGR